MANKENGTKANNRDTELVGIPSLKRLSCGFHLTIGNPTKSDPGIEEYPEKHQAAWSDLKIILS